MDYKKCEDEGCFAPAIVECRLPYWSDTRKRVEYDTHWHCQEHAIQHGFCYICGGFFGGIERFEFAAERGGIHGMCWNCEDTLRSEMGEYDYEEIDDETCLDNEEEY